MIVQKIVINVQKHWINQASLLRIDDHHRVNGRYHRWSVNEIKTRKSIVFLLRFRHRNLLIQMTIFTILKSNRIDRWNVILKFFVILFLFHQLCLLFSCYNSEIEWFSRLWIILDQNDVFVFFLFFCLNIKQRLSGITNGLVIGALSIFFSSFFYLCTSMINDRNYLFTLSG